MSEREQQTPVEDTDVLVPKSTESVEATGTSKWNQFLDEVSFLCLSQVSLSQRKQTVKRIRNISQIRLSLLRRKRGSSRE